ncbi:uncharacterized protein BO88DRAFT_466634 [Aspergillus vadensis CBS 113365]|uniref:Uncharacterized protein n=1 Tax=Aspergillus vadensis (strain CBS 113365 / IMI 142717 / IBT 24658) TaxID=1448311 RepID=A0A319BVL4_ASPVC|nr:hypothetical protein BO88DRAFT_466634 [Aspergillus vadensis CBS 113365]PYH67168.1 hypothetical protein BO88DRAFT_466634 [Aspergillus vadensis CBS 113365]
MVTLNEEQIPKPSPQMTMYVQALAQRREGPSKRRRLGKNSAWAWAGRAKMCATHGTAPLVNRRLKYTTILGKWFQI